MSRTPTVLAMGGGGFLMEPDNPLLDDHLLGLAGVARPRVAWLGTAQGDSDRGIVLFHQAMQDRDVRARHVRLFGAPGPGLADALLAQDVIYVGGGNTANLLAVWRVHGVDAVLAEAWRRGIVLGGVSAGMICWFEAGVTDSFGPLAALPDGLGLLPGSACPHYDGEAQRRPTYQGLVAGGFPPGLAADDGAALLFRGRELAEVVTSRPTARAYRVERADDGVRETPLPVRYLGAPAA
jgi:peptidase E